MIFGSHFVWGRIRAATRQGRGKRQILEENDIYATQLERWSCSRGWPSCHGLMFATLARAVTIICPRKKAQNITEYCDTATLTLSQPGYFVLQNQRGAQCDPPPSKNPVTLLELRIHSSKVFLKACPNVILLPQLRCQWKPWFIECSDFWLGIPVQKSKTLFPRLKDKKSNFFWKLIKHQIEWHLSWCNGDFIP